MDLVPPVFDQLWAVVTYEYYGGGPRLLWSATHRTWLPSHDYGTGFAKHPVPDFKGRPYDDELAAIPALANEMVRLRICQHCGLSDLADHFIAPDVCGQSALYCVQMPDKSVVGSFGGSGTRKHWGSLHACSAVKSCYYTDSDGDEYVEFGEGLVASHVRDWEWCNRCTNAASNIQHAAERNGMSFSDYEVGEQRRRLEARQRNRAAGPREVAPGYRPSRELLSRSADQDL